MLKPAFSTVACPHWTLAQVAQHADEFGFEAVELRTFGDDSRRFACDPAMTSPEKTRRLFGERGVEVLCLATSLKFDDFIGPPVIGPLLWDQEKAVREARRAIDLAASLECPFVRVFGMQVPAFEKRSACVARIADRLRMVADHANKTGVRIVVENAGSFARAGELLEILRAVDHGLVGACYSNAAACLAGESAAAGVPTLGDHLLVARVQDAKATTEPSASDADLQRRPCSLGEGELDARAFVRALVDARFTGPLVFEYPFAFVPGIAGPEQVLPGAARAMFDWLAGRESVQPAPGAAPHTLKPAARAGAARR